jgi:hypothetical protein
MAPIKGVFYPALVEAARQRIPRGPANLHELGVAGRRAAKARADAAAQLEAERIDRETRRAQRRHDRDPAVRAFRAARRSHATEFERVLPDARREYAAFLAAQEKKMRGGRPAKRSTA